MRLRLRTIASAGLSIALIAAPTLALAFQPPPQTEFVPAKDLPANESMPAAPLLVAAYAFFLIAVMFYLWTIWRRLNKVETEIRMLERNQTTRSHSS
jgi:hypothetical protein